MYSGQLVFSQLMDFLPMHRLRQCVNRYNGNHYVKSFSCLDQFLCMAFAQLSYRESLRDIESCMRAMQNKIYHLGIRSKISKSTLAEANEKEIGAYTQISPKFLSPLPESFMLMTISESN